MKPEQIKTYLKTLGLTDAYTAKSLSGGINSKVWKISDNEKHSVLKVYKSQDKEDKRDRFQVEYDFLKYCEQNKIENTPKLIASDPKKNWIQMTWIQGCKKKTLSNRDLKNICKFVETLNKRFTKHNWKHTASEAFLDYSQLLPQLKARLTQIMKMTSDQYYERDFSKWIKDELKIKWETRSEKYLATKDNQCWNQKYSDLILSPSDIGIHNLIENENGLIFYDFEYAGIDDSAKMICDLTIQPENIMTPAQYKFLIDLFHETTINCTEHLRRRIEILLPMYHFKWMLIMSKCYLKDPKPEYLRKILLYSDVNLDKYKAIA